MHHITHSEGFEFAKNLSRFYECMHADAQSLISTLRGYLNAGMLQKSTPLSFYLSSYFPSSLFDLEIFSHVIRNQPLVCAHPIPKPTSEVNHEDLSKFKGGSTTKRKLQLKHEVDLQEDKHVKTWSNLYKLKSYQVCFVQPLTQMENPKTILISLFYEFIEI